MNRVSLTESLRGLALGEVRYFDSVGSTNDEAQDWARAGAPDLSLVVADEQTAGRGRRGRQWFTPAGTALACSLVLRPTPLQQRHLSRTVGLLALAVTEALQQATLPAKIKWPNDVLVHGRKIAGILVESIWIGDKLDCQVAGFGVNIRTGAIPDEARLDFPATSVEACLDASPRREEVLRAILSSLIALRGNMHATTFVQRWEGSLAYLGEIVSVSGADGSVTAGRLLGLAGDGALRLQGEHDQPLTIRTGDVSLRPAA